MRTTEDSDVTELFSETLPHERVVEIFREVVGQVPANGVGHEEILEYWDALEQRLTDEIARQLGA